MFKMTPKFIGKRHLVNAPIQDIASRVNWRQYLSTLGINGDNRNTAAGKEALAEGQTELRKLVSRRRVSANAAVGFYEATPVGDTVQVNTPSPFTWRCGRQKHRADGRAGRSWSDHVDTHIGLFTCTVITGTPPDDLYQQIVLANLTDCLVEATAEWLHDSVRTYWWQGFCRPAPGYPSCPDYAVLPHIQNALGTEAIGVRVAGEYALSPSSTVSGFLIGDEEATYFGGVSL